jgi:hypothetical protein
MFKLNVPARVRMARLNECGKCKFYNAEHESCGTPMNLKGLVTGTHGGLVDLSELDGVVDESDVDTDIDLQDLNLVKYYKKKVRLCGCYVKEKTKYSFASCPVGKWAKYRLTDTETNMLEEFINSLPKVGKLSSAQVDSVIKWFERVSGRPMKRCDDCVRAIIKELKIQIGEKQDSQV